jgi:hypothetical protein
MRRRKRVRGSLAPKAPVIRRRPIPRSDYHWKPTAKPPQSLRYETILNGAVRLYPDGREVCQDNPVGRTEYARRVQVMVQRQNYRCSLCPGRLTPAGATCEHERRRGIGAAFRDDRILDSKDEWMNSAAHWKCNVERG